MAEKNVVKVVIDGKSVAVGGYESAEYMERVAFYINNKMAELREYPGYLRQSEDMRAILLALNIADDYYKAKMRADETEQEIEAKDGEGYETKQELVKAQMRIRELEQSLAAYKKTSSPVQMKMDVGRGNGNTGR